MWLEYVVVGAAIVFGLYLAFGAFEIFVFRYAGQYWHDKAYAARRGVITDEPMPWYVRYSRWRTADELNAIVEGYTSSRERELEKEYSETSKIDVVSREEV